MVIKMAEVTLAVYYREKQPNGEYQGGPTYYMQKGLGGEKKLPFWKLFAVLFGGCIFMTWFITLQNYTVSEAVGSTFHLPYIVPSLLYVAAIYLIIIGGVKKVGVISSYMTPIMCMLYIVGSLAILVVNFDKLPETFGLIFKGAFTTQAAVGGFADSVKEYSLSVDFPEHWLRIIPVERREALIGVLANDLRPSYQDDAERIYGFEFLRFDIRFTVRDRVLSVCEVVER